MSAILQEAVSRMPLPAAGLETVGTRLARYLKQLAVQHVFTVRGAAPRLLADAWGRAQIAAAPRLITARHEANVTLMAEGYARETGSLGVCYLPATGTAHCVTGMLNAQATRTPLLLITVQPPRHTSLRRRALPSTHATETLALMQQCTHYNAFVATADEFQDRFTAAVLTAHQSSGPVHLALGADVLFEAVPGAATINDLMGLTERSRGIDEVVVDALYRDMLHGQRLVLLVGAGCTEAARSLLEFARLTGAAWVATPYSQGLVSHRHPLFRGVVGVGGHASAYAALVEREVTRVIAVGHGFDSASLGAGDWNALPTDKILHIDSAPAAVAGAVLGGDYLQGDVAAVFAQLVARLSADRDTHPTTRMESHAGAPLPEPLLLGDDQDAVLTPGTALALLPRLLPPGTPFVVDEGEPLEWATRWLAPFDRRIHGQRTRRDDLLRCGSTHAPKGWAIGMAIGTACGGRRGPVVCISDCDGVLAAGQEMRVAVTEQLNVIFVALNTWPDDDSGRTTVDVGGYAQALGIAAHVIGSAAELLQLDLAEIIKQRRPVMLDIRLVA